MKKNNIHTVEMVVAGAVAIAGAAVATTMALKDEKTRKKMKNVLQSVKKQAIDYAETVSKEPLVLEGENTLKKIVTDTKSAVDTALHTKK